jgi:hypothetical protein
MAFIPSRSPKGAQGKEILAQHPQGELGGPKGKISEPLAYLELSVIREANNLS